MIRLGIFNPLIYCANCAIGTNIYFFIPSNSIALTYNIFTELANTMRYGEGGLYSIIFTV